MSANQEFDAIKSLSVSKLFGRFDHKIEFPEKDNIVIITAPNGYGKTVLLRILDSIFNRKFNYLSKIDFDEIRVEFDSRKSLLIYRNFNIESNDEDDKEKRSIYFNSRGFDSDDEDFKFPPKNRSFKSRSSYRENDFSNLLRYKLLSRSTDSSSSLDDVKLPVWLEQALDYVNVNLVETQRLLHLKRSSRESWLDDDEETPLSVVEEDANDLEKRIGQLLQHYANESQQLDETFAKRILEFENNEVSDEEQIRSNLQILTEKRDSLVSVGLLGKTDSEPINPSEVLPEENFRRILKEKNIRRIFEIYIENTKKKLEIFDKTYEKVRLFEQILNKRFSFKAIEIHPQEGFRAIDKDNNQAIPLQDLSSGEQHELVLTYELLFKVEENSIILIDEPELSLHVTWQENFISDLQKIQELNKLMVVIATHSPQIIDDKWDLVQELKK